jgi:hypothetical protein
MRGLSENSESKQNHYLNYHVKTMKSTDINRLETPIEIRSVDKSGFLFYLAGKAPMSVTELATHCSSSEGYVKKVLHDRFESEVHTDSTGFLTLTDSARSQIETEVKLLVAEAVERQKQGNTETRDENYEAATEHYQTAETLLSEAETRLSTVRDVPGKLKSRLESVRETHDKVHRKVSLDDLKHQKLLADQREEEGDNALDSGDYPTAVDVFEAAIEALEDSKELIEAYNQQRLSPDSKRWDPTNVDDRLESLKEKRERAQQKLEEKQTEPTDTEESSPSTETGSNKSKNRHTSGYRANKATKNKIIDEIRRRSSELGRMPRAEEVVNHVSWEHHDVLSHFDSWDEALEAAGIDKRQELIDDLKQTSREVDGRPSLRDKNQHGEFSGSMYYDVFESWGDALEAAGVDQDSSTETEGGTQSEERDAAEATTDSSPTKSEIIDEIRRRKSKLGRMPHCREVVEEVPWNRHDVHSYFDSWDDALEAAGIDKQQALLDEIKRVADKLGRVPKSTDIEEHGAYSSATYTRYFGSWSTALEQSGAEDRSEEERKRELLETLRTLRDNLDRVPKTTDLPEKCEYSPNDFYQKFGTWDEALEAAGIDKEQALLNEIRRVADKLGHTPTSSDIDEHGTYSSSAYRTYFGSLGTALERSGLDENREDDLLETLQSLDERLDRLPKATDLEDVSGVSQHDYIRKFGSWDEALEAAGIDKEEVLIDDLQQVATEVDGTPGTTAVNQHGTYSARMYQKYFGSWDAALLAAGLSTTATATGKKQETEEVATDTATLPPSTPIDDIKHRVNGVGSSAIHALKQAGYTTLGELHGAQPEDITTYKGIGRAKALKLIRFATEHLFSFGTVTQPSADHHPPAEGSQTSPSNAGAKIQPSALETSWETIPDNERIDDQFLIQVTDVDRRAGNRKTSQLNVRGLNGREFKMNVWSKHDVDQKFTKDRWYALENARGKVWESSDGATQKQLSSTKDLNVVDLGTDFDPNAASIRDTSKAASEPQQPEVTTNEDISKSTPDSTSAHQDTAATTNETDSSGDDSPEVDDDGILGDIMSDFDVS